VPDAAGSKISTPSYPNDCLIFVELRAVPLDRTEDLESCFGSVGGSRWPVSWEVVMALTWLSELESLDFECRLISLSAVKQTRKRACNVPGVDSQKFQT
jgi:hypothetical protein